MVRHIWSEELWTLHLLISDPSGLSLIPYVNAIRIDELAHNNPFLRYIICLCLATTITFPSCKSVWLKSSLNQNCMLSFVCYTYCVFIIRFLVVPFCPQARVPHWEGCIRQDGLCPSGRGTEWNRNVKGEVFIFSESSPAFDPPAAFCSACLFLCMLLLCSFIPSPLFPSAGGSLPKCQLSANRCVWFRGTLVCVRIFKRPSELRAIVI